MSVFKSKSDYFKQSSEVLLKDLILLENLLHNYGFTNEQIDIFKRAFYHMCDNPNHFDGATLVSDMEIIKGLDPFAMLHDYLYIYFKLQGNFKRKYEADFIYKKIIQKPKIMTYFDFQAWLRFIGLTIASPIYVPYQRIIKRKVFVKDAEFNEIVKIFK